MMDSTVCVAVQTFLYHITCKHCGMAQCLGNCNTFKRFEVQNHLRSLEFVTHQNLEYGTCNTFTQFLECSSKMHEIDLGN